MSAPVDAAQSLVQTSNDQNSSIPVDAVANTTTNDASGGQSAAAASGASELARTKITLLGALGHFPDFPIPGIKFIDILPLFQDVTVHLALLRALELQVLEFGQKPDVIVGLDARGFLFGPSLALRLGASFVPVRKKGKMPGPCVTAAYEKEYGTDFFQMQEGAVKPGQKVLVVDDIIATGELKNFAIAPFTEQSLALGRKKPRQIFRTPCPAASSPEIPVIRAKALANPSPVLLEHFPKA